MINIEIDEAGAFDYLSILEAKDIRISNNLTLIAFLNCYRKIDYQLKIFHISIDRIILSKEYEKLKDTNLQIFDIIEEIRKGAKIDASIPDKLNMQRFKIKKQLQKKFFKSKLQEIKTNE